MYKTKITDTKVELMTLKDVFVCLEVWKINLSWQEINVFIILMMPSISVTQVFLLLALFHFTSSLPVRYDRLSKSHRNCWKVQNLIYPLKNTKQLNIFPRNPSLIPLNTVHALLPSHQNNILISIKLDKLCNKDFIVLFSVRFPLNVFSNTVFSSGEKVLFFLILFFVIV